MIEKLIDIAIEKQGNKRQLGIYLGFNEKYAGQRVDKLIKNQNFKMNTFLKLMKAAGLLNILKVAITAEHEKISKK